jgi:hypothetical protein
VYKLQRDLVRDLVHENANLCEISQKRVGRLHYEVLPILKDIVQGLLKFKVKKKVKCKGFVLSKHVKDYFPRGKHRLRYILSILRLRLFSLIIPIGSPRFTLGRPRMGY